MKKHLPFPVRRDKSKGELKSEIKIIKEKAAMYFSLARTLAAELYAICPFHRIFQENVFTDSTKEAIQKDSRVCVIDSSWDKITYIGDKEETITINISELKKEIETALQKEKELENGKQVN